MSQIQFISIDSELGAGTRGSSLGIAALKIASVNKSDIFKKYPIINIDSKNDALLGGWQYKFAKHIEHIIKTQESLSNTISKQYNKAFNIILTGDHSNGAGTLAGIKAANIDKRIGVIWIDAHADFHSPYTTPSGNMHGMPLAIASAIDNKEMARNSPDKKVLELWDHLKNSNNISPKIKAEDIVFIGLRNLEKPEEEIIKENDISVFTVDQCRKYSIGEVKKQIDLKLKECDIVHISFDIDSLDKKWVQGTGTPVENGFDEDEATNIIITLLQSPKVNSFEITEINPLLDDCNKTAEIGLRILESVVKEIEKR